MSLNKEKLLLTLAMAVLIIGTFSTLYVNANSLANNNQSNSIIINNQTYDINIIFSKISTISIETDLGERTGSPLDQIIIYTSESCPSCYKYQIKSSDGYQQTVNWEDLQKGIFTSEKTVIFPHLAHSFWVKDVIEIEVK
jgi:hypothetical protein